MRFDRHDLIYRLNYSWFFSIFFDRRRRSRRHRRRRQLLSLLIQIKRKLKRRRKRPTGRALRAPLAGSPACVFAFVFVLIYV